MATEKYLQNYLNSTEHPLKMKEVAQRLNIDRRTIYNYRTYARIILRDGFLSC